MSRYGQFDAGRKPVREILVVIPARNEERRLPRTLVAIDRARRRLSAHAFAVPVRVVVALDHCTDRSAEVVAQWTDVEVVTTSAGRVGRARAAGIRHGLSGSDRPSAAIWIANSDADSEVPDDWFITQLGQARAGTDLWLGTVRPDPDELDDLMLAAWSNQHRLEDGHPHVHGANLGIRADCYLRAGGFAPVAAHEDRLLVDAVRRCGGVVRSTGASPVLTSGRLVGRTPEGFAHYLRALSSADGALVSMSDPG